MVLWIVGLASIESLDGLGSGKFGRWIRVNREQ